MALLLLDANSIVNRAFYGIRTLSTKDGRPTNAIYGFLSILQKLQDKVNPAGVVAAFDMRAPTFRHKQFDAYKAGRKGMPDELAMQLEPLKNILASMGCHIVECEGYEADDIIGTLALACEENEKNCFIATGDRDSFQLVSEKVSVLFSTTKFGQPETTEYTPAMIEEKYGLSPKQLIDLKGFMGDSSDNIPGVAGVGEKTALSLMTQFGSMDYIFENLDTLDVKEAVRNRLEMGKEMAHLSRMLGTINCHVPISVELEDYVKKERDSVSLGSQLADLELFSFIEKWGLTNQPAQMTFDENSVSADVLTFVNKEELHKITVSKKTYITHESVSGKTEKIFIANDEFYTICSAEDETWADILSNADIDKSVHDLKPLAKMMLKDGKTPHNVSVDTLLAAYLLNPLSSDYSLKRLATEYDTDILVCENDENDDETPDIVFMKGVSEKLTAETLKMGMHDLLCDTEIPLSVVLADMENVGFLVDRDGIEQFGKKIEGKIASIEKSITAEIGYEFNLNSPKQLAVALFEDLGLPAKKKTKTGFSTNAEVLEGLKDKHPVISEILEYRTLAKLRSTYCDGLLKVIGEDGRIHSSFNQAETRTGRISSTEPNLQNIPVRQELGREIRKFFIAKEGHVLCDADYSQIELRVLADMSGDQNMIDAFASDVDIHMVTASEVFGVPLADVTSVMRFRAKAVNFGIVYGIGAHSLSKDIGVSYSEAKKYIEEYLRHYSGVAKFMEQLIESAKENGYAKTMFGRRRPLPELSASHAASRSFGERVARNMPIQGTAADIIKIAMIKVKKRLDDEKLSAKLILQVHDELIIESPVHEKDIVRDMLTFEMENAITFKVPLKVDVNVGKTWYDTKE